jgi:hypothetical protein
MDKAPRDCGGDKVWEGEIKKEKEKEKIKEEGKGKIRGKEKENKKEKGRVLWTFHSSHPPFNYRRSCFAKCFYKMDSAPSYNPLHQHSHSLSRHSRSPTKRALPNGP